MLSGGRFKRGPAQHSARVVLWVFAALALACPSLGWSESRATAGAHTLDAMWQLQQLTFRYRADGIYYSCAGLIDRVTAVLQAVGTHSKVVVGTPCIDFSGSQELNLLVANPTEATPERVRAAATFSAEQRLVARLRAARLPTEEDIERFPAAWQTVNVTRAVRPLQLRSTDCQLLHSIREQLFTRLGVHVPERGFPCSLLASRAPPRIVVEALRRTSG